MPDSPDSFPRGDRKSQASERAAHGSFDAQIAEVAGRQFGVIALWQLLAIGLSYAEIEGRVNRGLLHRLYHGVYAVGHRRIVPHGRLLASQLTCGPDAFLSHRSAAAVWGLRAISTKEIEVTVPGCSRRSRSGIKVHQTGRVVDPADLAVRHGLRISSVPGMLIELAARERPVELDRLITQSVRRQVFDLPAIESALTRHHRRPGAGRLRTALKYYLPRPERKSDLERAFDQLLAAHPEIPEPVRNVHLGIWEVDCFWPEQKLALELDGRPYHEAVRDMEKDRIKDAKLQRMGFKVLRISEMRLELDPRGVLEDLCALLSLSTPGRHQPRAGRA